LKIEGDELKKIEFNDCSVVSVSMDRKEKNTRFHLDGAYIGEIGSVDLLGAGTLSIVGWNEVTIKSFNHENEIWTEIEDPSLSEICEFELSTSTILRGFSKGGPWKEITFINPAHVWYEEAKKG
jgi:hypothetical protein